MEGTFLTRFMKAQTPGQCLVVQQTPSSMASDPASSSRNMMLTVASSPYQARRQSAPLDASIVEVGPTMQSAWHRLIALRIGVTNGWA